MTYWVEASDLLGWGKILMPIRSSSDAHQNFLSCPSEMSADVSFFPREGAETGGSGRLTGLEMNFFEKSFEPQKFDFDQ